MKTLFLCILFGTNIFFTQSQNTWEYYEKGNGYREIVSHAVEYEKHSLISVSMVIYQSQNNSEENSYESTIRIHNLETGAIIREVEYSIDSLSARLFWVFYNEIDRKFIIAGEAHHIEEDGKSGYFLVTKWDEDLNLISDTLVKLEPFEDNELWYLSGNMKKEKEFLLVGYCSKLIKGTPFNTQIQVCRLSDQGEIEDIKWHRTKKYNNSIFYDDEIDKYVLFASETFYLNNELEIVDSITTLDAGHYNSGYVGYATKFDKNRYLVSVRGDSEIERGIAFFDSELNHIKDVIIERANTIGFGFDAPIVKPNFDYIDTSEIYFGSFDAFFNYFSIGKVNSNLEPFWIKYYSLEDGFRHYIWSIAATSDGGCVVAGGKGEDMINNVPNDLSAWVLKLNGNGDLVSTDDPTIERWEITVYPNPSSGDFIIEIGEMIEAPELFLYDINGQELWQNADLHKGENKFFFHGLQTGMYVWRLVVNGKHIGGGMWVKK